MIGTNKIELNEASMKQAMEMYLDYLFNEEHQSNEVVSIDATFGSYMVTFKKREKPAETTESRACL